MIKLLKEFFYILENNKISFLSVVFFNILFSIVELISLGSLVPAIFLFKDYQKFISIFSEYTGYLFLEGMSKEEIFIYFILIIFFIFLFKFIFLWILTKKKYAFFKKITEENIVKTFKYFISQDPIFYSKNSISYLFQCMEEVRVFFQNTLFNILLVIQDMILGLVITIILLNVNFQTTFSIIIFLTFVSIIIFYLTNYKLVSCGKEKFHASENLLNIYKESILGFREIKVFNAKIFFLNRLNFFLHKYLNSYYRLELLKFMPKNFFELAIIIFLLIIFYFLSISSNSFDNFLLTLTVYVLCFLRLMPLVNRILSNYQTVKAGTYNYNQIKSFMFNQNKYEHKKKLTELPLQIQDNIEFVNIDFEFEKNKIFENLSIKLNMGQSIAILGPSGSGKSTFIDILMGFLKISKGNIFCDGKKVENLNYSWLKNFSYISQKIYLNNSSLKSNIAYGVNDENINQDQLLFAINNSKLDLFIKDKKLNDIFISDFGNNLSGGQIQRIGIARALYKESSVIIFDESTSSLDENTEEEILKTIKTLKKMNKMIIFVTHKKSLANHFDKVFYLENRKLVEK